MMESVNILLESEEYTLLDDDPDSIQTAPLSGRKQLEGAGWGEGGGGGDVGSAEQTFKWHTFSGC